MRGAVVFAFDDGADSVQLAYDVLQPAGIRATIPTNTTLVGTDADRLGWTELDAMVDGGWELTNHGREHLDLTTLAGSALTDEIDGGQADLLARGYPNLGHLHFVVPFHTTSAAVRTAVMVNHVSNRDESTTTQSFAIPISLALRRNLRSRAWSTAALDIAGAQDLISSAIDGGELAMVHTHGGDTTSWTTMRDWIVANDYIDDCHTMTSLFAKYEWLWTRSQPLVGGRPPGY